MGVVQGRRHEAVGAPGRSAPELLTSQLVQRTTLFDTSRTGLTLHTLLVDGKIQLHSCKSVSSALSQ